MKNKNIIRIAIVTGLILMIPLVAMQFVEGWNWSLIDFIAAGALIFSTGLSYELISRKGSNTRYKIAVGIAIGTAFLLTWINMAVGFVGSGANPPNVMYFGVIGVGIIGVTVARLQAKGMSYALFAMATAQFLVPVIALIFWKPVIDDPVGIVGVFMLNLFFVMLFGISGLLFRHSSNNNSQIKASV